MLEIDPTITLTIDVASPEGTRRRVTVAGELDLASAAELRSRLDAELTDGHDVELDLSGVTFVDSTGLGVLVRAAQRAQAAGTGFVMREPLPPQMRRVLRVTGLDRRLPIAPASDSPGP